MPIQDLKQKKIDIIKKADSPMDKLQKLLETTVEAPSITDTLEKAKNALGAAQRAKQKIVQGWCCTECGSPHIQLYLDGGGSGHFDVQIEDDVPVHTNGSQLGRREQRNMDRAIAKKAAGHQQGGIMK